MLVLTGKPGEIAWTVEHDGETQALTVIKVTLRAADGSVRRIPGGWLPYVRLGFDGPRSFQVGRNRRLSESPDV